MLHVLRLKMLRTEDTHMPPSKLMIRHVYMYIYIYMIIYVYIAPAFRHTYLGVEGGCRRMHVCVCVCVRARLPACLCPLPGLSSESRVSADGINFT